MAALASVVVAKAPSVPLPNGEYVCLEVRSPLNCSVQGAVTVGSHALRADCAADRST